MMVVEKKVKGREAGLAESPQAGCLPISIGPHHHSPHTAMSQQEGREQEQLTQIGLQNAGQLAGAAHFTSVYRTSSGNRRLTC